MSKSTVVMSKRQKMRQKKQQKISNHIIQVIDSDEGQKKKGSEPIGNTNLIPEIRQQPAKRKFNVFNLDMIKRKMQPKKAVQEQVLIPKILRVQECDGSIANKSYDGRSLVTYHTKGSTNVKYISQNNFQSRITMIAEEQNHKNNKKIIFDSQGQEGGDNKEEKEKEENHEKKEQKFLRYFDVIEQKNSDDEDELKIVKCFRCGGKGHIARNCHEEVEKVKCLFCLGDHHHSDCTDKLCFRCNQSGHVSQECRKTGIKCRKCRKIGHIQKECGGIIMLDYSNNTQREIQERIDHNDMKKLKCLGNCEDPRGHFNCYQYRKKLYNVYEKVKRK